ncbi:TlpA family protein disulfide reductase [Mucilaginibacter mali]|uniref:TlpA family protein disulfide reductase n=1 Tax=Mucilaginibacter mali TaxID=2740462 RepID=A0A7D4PWL3_9SPHI|nr:TlpA disulfide reductase family protein [Mucilaginibacter mali]QKJ32568.1 TlpA family protein disulfide reductase [Mucilaginibacter mali]
MMQKFVKAALFVWLTGCAQTLLAQNPLTSSPAFPERGQEVTITYHAGSPGAKIPAGAKNISLVFTYSTFYELPYKLPLVQHGNDWSVTFKLQRYATFATFYVQSDNIIDKPADNKHYNIAVYTNGKRVENGYLHEAYSLSAQMGRSALVHDMQRQLLQTELENYPDNYEAKIRLITNGIAGTKDAAEKKKLYEQGEQMIAGYFAQAPTVMGRINKVTMGYLILGENSRVDSVHRVVVNKYPNSDAAMDLLTEIVNKEKDTTKRIIKLEQALKTAKDPRGDGAKSLHSDLFDYYAARKNAPKALYHARFFRNDTSPHRARTLKEIAETLTKNHLAPDTALKYAGQALAIVDTYPVGIIRYFPEFGYIPAYVADSTRAKQVGMARASLLSIAAINHISKGHTITAIKEADEAVTLSDDKQTLNNIAWVYERQHQPEKAFNTYWKILLKEPGDSLALKASRKNYQAYKGSADGYKERLAELEKIQKQQMTRLVKKELLNLPGPQLLAITDLQGHPLDKESLKGKVVIMDFWATWCVPCMEELPYLQKVYTKYKDNPRVVFMVINSGSKNTLADAQNWAKQHSNYTFPLFYNGDSNIGDKVGFNLIPTIAVLDRSGKMQLRTIGFEGAVLEQKLSAGIDLLLEGM